MKRVLLDEGVPRPLAKKLRGFGRNVTTFPNEWKQLSNGRLLDEVVRSGFNVLLTCDKQMAYQQNLGTRELAVLILPTNRLVAVMVLAGEIAALVPDLPVGRFSKFGSDS